LGFQIGRDDWKRFLDLGKQHPKDSIENRDAKNKVNECILDKKLGL
jgi:hypothetical protein